MPLYHCFGCVIGTMSALASGAAIDSAQLDIRSAGDASGGASGAGHIALRRSGHVHRRAGTCRISSLIDLSSLRTGMMAGAPCPVEVMKRVMCEMRCAELTIGYGQTESTPVVTMSTPDDPVEVRVSTSERPCRARR